MTIYPFSKLCDLADRIYGGDDITVAHATDVLWLRHTVEAWEKIMSSPEISVKTMDVMADEAAMAYGVANTLGDEVMKEYAHHQVVNCEGLKWFTLRCCGIEQGND